MQRSLVLVMAMVLAGSTVASAQSAGGSPSPVPSVAPTPTPPPTPTATPTPVQIPDIPLDPGTATDPGGLAWERIDLPATAEPNDLGGLMAWAGGFAMLEQRRGGPRGLATVAVWTSPDGRSWARHRLPDPVRPGTNTSLQPLGDGLALITIAYRGDSILFGAKRISVLRSDDGRRWRPGAGVELGVPAGFPRVWTLDFPSIVAAGDRLVAIARLGPNLCCGSAPVATRWASVGAWPARADHLPSTRPPRPPARLVAWESVRGGTWQPVPIRVTGTSEPVDAIESIGRKGELLTGVVLDGGYRAVFSRDGIAWWPGARFPADFAWGGAQGVAGDDGWTILLGERDAEPRLADWGNRFAAWLVGPGGAPSLVIDRQPAFPSGWAADGDTLVILGRSWPNEGEGYWSWLLVSHDRGRAWDPDLAWSGGLGATYTDLVLHDGVLVMRRVDDPVPGVWVAPLPDAG